MHENAVKERLSKFREAVSLLLMVTKSSLNDGVARADGKRPVKPVSRLQATLVLLLGTAFLSGTPLWVKATNMDPATQAFLRVSIAMLMLLPFAIREAKTKMALPKAGVIMSIVAGLFLGVDFTCWNYSIFYIGAGVAAILLNLQVIVVPILTAIFDKYRIPGYFIVLVPIMVVGVLFTGGVFEPAEATGPETIYGIKTSVLGTALGLTSGICYSFYLYFSRKASVSAPRKDLYIQPMFWTMVAQMVAPTIWAYTGSPRGGFDFKYGVLIDGQLPMVNPETTLGDPLTGTNWFHLICLIVLGQALAWTMVQYGSVWLEPVLSAGILLLSPVTSLILAWPLFGEIPSPLQWLGVVMILGSVMYQNGLLDFLKPKSRRAKKEGDGQAGGTAAGSSGGSSQPTSEDPQAVGAGS
ncbi:Permease of the drug/metabolite transporter (DMT) superfamily [Actinobaculum suis]|nr:Permease of the drug/metabolite transporter (DMT) superfamily [Actinobaculum suis]